MSRGGKRDGAGRPRNVGRPEGIVETEPRANRKKLPVPTDTALQEFEQFNRKFYLKLKPYLTPETTKLYEDLMEGTAGATPVECMKQVLHDLMVRYKIGRIEELKANRTWEGLTKEVDSIRQLAESISRIEQASPTLQLNILNILTQDSHKEKAKEVTNKIFKIEDSSEAEFDIVDKGITGIDGNTGLNI